MAEIGIIASVAGIISLGMQVCDGLTIYYKAYSKAEDDIKSLHLEVKGLTQSLWSFGKSAQGCRAVEDPENFAFDPIEVGKARILELDAELRKRLESRQDGRQLMRQIISCVFERSILSKPKR